MALFPPGRQKGILAGNLQHYFSDHSVMQMDLETARELNQLIKAGAEVRTITDCFYHGKMYVLICDDITFVIVGSTNVSRNAFRYNNELDNLFVYGAFENQHRKHFETLWNNAVSISELNEAQFTQRIASDEGEQRHMLDIDSMKDRIKQIEDADLRNRLVTWLKYAPSSIYDKLDVGGHEYIAIEFADKKMIVLESFFSGNSYFVFYNHSIDTLLGAIEGRSKTEVFELSGMEKRGYHIREKLKLEVKIASYFV